MFVSKLQKYIKKHNKKDESIQKFLMTKSRKKTQIVKSTKKREGCGKPLQSRVVMWVFVCDKEQ